MENFDFPGIMTAIGTLSSAVQTSFLPKSMLVPSVNTSPWINACGTCPDATSLNTVAFKVDHISGMPNEILKTQSSECYWYVSDLLYLAWSHTGGVYAMAGPETTCHEPWFC